MRWADEAKGFIRLLQWGRGLKTPEIYGRLFISLGDQPLQWGRGLKTPEIPPRLALFDAFLRFNGAGVLRPRKSAAQPGCGGAAQSFNGAGVLRPRKFDGAGQIQAGLE